MGLTLCGYYWLYPKNKKTTFKVKGIPNNRSSVWKQNQNSCSHLRHQKLKIIIQKKLVYENNFGGYFYRILEGLNVKPAAASNQGSVKHGIKTFEKENSILNMSKIHSSCRFSFCYMVLKRLEEKTGLDIWIGWKAIQA